MNEKEKVIVHIAQSAGGVKEYLYMLLKNMNPKYINILILSEEYKKYQKEFEKVSQDIYYVPMTRDVSIVKDIKAIINVKKILKNIHPNIVYCHSSKAGAIGRIALLLNRKIKVIYNAHGWYFNAEIPKVKKKIFAFIERMLAKKSNIIINISESELESALNYKIAKKEKMLIIKNCIDFEKYKIDLKQARIISRKQYNIEDNEILIGTVGRIAEQKNPLLMYRAFKKINEKYPNTKLIYVGDGNLKEELLKNVQNDNLTDKVIITGWVEKTQNVIPAIDIAVLPSKWEGFGLVLIEYMLCDKAIVASATGGILDIIKDDENGLLFKNDDENSLYEKIELLIEKEEIGRKMIENNKSYRNIYEIEKLEKEHEKIFEELT